MNLLIVGRKSKTQMRNMFYWAGIISILICLPLRVSAQSYEQMWKQVEVLEQKQLPKSAIQELRKIYEYAKQENTPNRILPHNPWNIHARFLHKAGRIYNTYARELYFFHEGTIDLRRRIYRCNANHL